MDVEVQEYTTDYEALKAEGLQLPRPTFFLSDIEVNNALWATIQALASKRSTYLHNTNHLSARELYHWLWHHGLRQEVKAVVMEGCSMHLDVLGGCSEADLCNYLRYYADEAYREMWAQDFPDDIIPPHEELPYDRDRCLPRPKREE